MSVRITRLARVWLVAPKQTSIFTTRGVANLARSLGRGVHPRVAANLARPTEPKGGVTVKEARPRHGSLPEISGKVSKRGKLGKMHAQDMQASCQLAYPKNQGKMLA